MALPGRIQLFDRPDPFMEEFLRRLAAPQPLAPVEAPPAPQIIVIQSEGNGQRIVPSPG